MNLHIHKKGKNTLLHSIIITAAILCGLSSSAFAEGDGEELHFINLAGFYAVDKTYTFPAVIKGNEGALLNALDGKGHYIFLSHESGVAHDDVINIQNDLLRSRAGQFEDYGIDCSFGVMMKDDAGNHNGIKITGQCKAHLVEHDGSTLNSSAIIKPVELPDIESADEERWKLIYHDKAGLILYANAES